MLYINQTLKLKKNQRFKFFTYKLIAYTDIYNCKSTDKPIAFEWGRGVGFENIFDVDSPTSDKLLWCNFSKKSPVVLNTND